MSASARGAGAHTCRTITAFFPACLPCSITTTLPDFKLRGNRAMVRPAEASPPARGARHGAGAGCYLMTFPCDYTPVPSLNPPC